MDYNVKNSLRIALTIGIILLASTGFAQQRIQPASFFEADPVKVGDASFEASLNHAIEAFYSADWDKTKELLGQLRTLENNDLRIHFFEAMIPFWSYFFGGYQPSDADAFLSSSSNAIAIGDQILQDSPQDTSVILLMGGLHGYRSLVAASEKRYRTAISSGLTGHSFTKVLLSMDDDDPNTLMGQGVFEYMIGSIPREARWIARLAGLSGSVEKGFEILEQAAQSNSYISNDAGMFLAYFYEQEQRFDDSIRHLDILLEKYPENIIFHYNRARVLELMGKPNQASAGYRQALKLRDVPVPVLIDLSRERLQALQ